jgi:hypothetical protein
MITQLAHQKKTNAAIKLSQRGQNKAAEVLAPLEASASRTPPVEEKRCARSPGPSTTTHMVGAGCTPCPPRGPPQPRHRRKLNPGRAALDLVACERSSSLGTNQVTEPVGLRSDRSPDAIRSNHQSVEQAARWFDSQRERERACILTNFRAASVVQSRGLCLDRPGRGQTVLCHVGMLWSGSLFV